MCRSLPFNKTHLIDVHMQCICSYTVMKICICFFFSMFVYARVPFFQWGHWIFVYFFFLSFYSLVRSVVLRLPCSMLTRSAVVLHALSQNESHFWVNEKRHTCKNVNQLANIAWIQATTCIAYPDHYAEHFIVLFCMLIPDTHNF